MKYSIALVIMLFLTSKSFAKTEVALIDYDKLDLTVTVTSLRAGNQDPSGDNSYYFKLTASALPILKEEIKKPFAERQKVERTIGEFASLQIKSLKYWQPDPKTLKNFTQSMTGDIVREIAAETMRQYKVAEQAVAVLCQVEMFERNKKFNFLGNDTRVGEVMFPIIPDTLPHGPKLENRELLIQDESGTYVELSIKFKALETKKADEK
ncbi:MAG: hypothetical protein NTX25_14630 [Proteobacteria bacterium]|nr:hypothetical protein [Pseudomonadota bacterium]